jgi:putative ABC transport system permease protein
LLGSNWWNVFTVAGSSPVTESGETPNAAMAPVTAGYFETLRIPLIKGRFFDRSDTPSSVPVAIVNSSLAKKFWPGEDPIGKHVRQGRSDNPYGPWRTIVGVVGDTKVHGVDLDAPQQLFLPIVQQPRTTVVAIARTRGPVASASLEAVLHDLDRSIPVFNDRTVDQLLRESSGRRRIATIVLSVFGGVAVLLAAIGVYGVIAQGVTERRQEIGVRMALGATRGQVLRLFLGQGLVAVVVGIGFGIVAAVAAARSLAGLVFGVGTTDPMTFAAVAALLSGVTLLACYVPAQFATRIDPMETLRSE